MSYFKMGGFGTFQIWMCAAVLVIAKTNASTIKFEAYPSVIKTNLTNSVSMRCNLADTRTSNGQIGKRSVMATTDDIVHISAIRVTRNDGQDVASVTPFDAPMAVVDQGNLQVKGDVSGASSQGYLELSWKDPTSMTVGGYTCEISTTDARQQTVVFKTSLEMAEVAPTINDVIVEFKAQKDVLISQIAKLQQCSSHRVAFMSSVSTFNAAHIMNVAFGQTVVFDKLIYSNGGAYDTRTGLFTCSQPGLYHFTVHVLEAHKGELDLDLMLNSQLITSVYARDLDTVESGSMSAVLHLKKNDVVKVVGAYAYAAAELYNDVNTPQSNVFMGHMIQSDDCVA